MRKIREILRLHFTAKLSNRQIGDCLRISKTTVQDCLNRFTKTDLAWPLPAELSDDDFHSKLYPGVEVREGKPQPDWVKIHSEMQRRHMTLQLLWQEYRETFPDGLGRTQFYAHYRVFSKSQKNPNMSMIHKGGEKLFVDYSGDGLSYVDRRTGSIIPVALFVASWAASSYCFADVAENRKLRNWILLHRRMYRFFDCVPALTIPDNEKTGVTKADKYEPVLQPTYALLGEHYNTVILPTRPNRPKDKAGVESNVLHIQRYILARLRDRIFFSLEEIRQAIQEELEAFNNQPMQQYKVSRKQRFEELDKPFAKPMPAEDFPYVALKINVLVAKDYHIEYKEFYYSVPYALCNERVEVRCGLQVIEIFHNHTRVASHPIGKARYGRSTTSEHMPKNHKFVKGWSPDYFLNRAIAVGPQTVELFKSIMSGCGHPEQGYRKMMGILGLRSKYKVERIENAAQRALHYHQPTLKAIRSILETGLDNSPLESNVETAPLSTSPTAPSHENIRGADYYSNVSSPLHSQEVSKCC